MLGYLTETDSIGLMWSGLAPLGVEGLSGRADLIIEAADIIAEMMEHRAEDQMAAMDHLDPVWRRFYENQTE